MSVNIKVTGGGGWKKRLEGIAEKAGGYEVQVGIPEGATFSGEGGHKAGSPIAEVGAAIEYGTATSPQRSFLRATMAEKQGEWRQSVSGFFGGDASNVEQALDLLGQVAALDIQEKINKGLEPGLKPETIERKTKMGYGANAAIAGVLTGETMRSIKHQVVPK